METVDSVPKLDAADLDAAPTAVTVPPASAPTVSAPAAALPTWLQQLGTESYEAELLISGFAIVGSWQLLGILEPVGEWMIFHLRYEVLAYARWALYYLALSAIILPALFVFHFGLRTYWVGLVGLSSVFPHGFGKHYGAVPQWIVDDTAARSPTLAAQIESIDRRASVVFAVAALSAIVFVSVAITVCAIMLLGYVVETVTGGGVSFTRIFQGLMALIGALYVAMMGMLALKRFHDRPLFRRVYLGLNVAMRKFMYSIFERPATYLITLLTTNLNPKRMIVPGLAGVVFLFVGVSFLFTSPTVRYLMLPERILEDGLRTDWYEPNRYWDAWREDGSPSVVPSVASEYLDAGATSLKVFVPILGEEDYRIDQRTPEPEEPDGIELADWRKMRRAANLARHRDFYRVRLDGRVLPVEAFVFAEPDGQAQGVLMTVVLPEGVNGAATVEVDARVSAVAGDTSWATRGVVPVVFRGR